MTDIDLTVKAAENIMGWTVFSLDCFHRFGHKVAHLQKSGVNMDDEGFWVVTRPGCADLQWNPLRFESDAFLLVKTLVARGFGISLHGPFSQDRVSDPNWCCAVYQGEVNGVHCDLEPARAITIACLRAVGVNTE